MPQEENTLDPGFLRQFIGETHIGAMLRDARGRARLADFAARFEALPMLARQSLRSIPRDTPITLQYCAPSWRFSVIARDASRPEAPQAFGVVHPKQGGSYLLSLNLGEIVGCHVDLDLDWTPKPLSEVLAPPSGRRDKPEPDFLPAP